MKLSRLIWYGVGGVIAGLLIENKSLKVKDKVASKGRSVKKKLDKAISHHK